MSLRYLFLLVLGSLSFVAASTSQTTDGAIVGTCSFLIAIVMALGQPLLAPILVVLSVALLVCRRSWIPDNFDYQAKLRDLERENNTLAAQLSQVAHEATVLPKMEALVEKLKRTVANKDALLSTKLTRVCHNEYNRVVGQNRELERRLKLYTDGTAVQNLNGRIDENTHIVAQQRQTIDRLTRRNESYQSRLTALNKDHAQELTKLKSENEELKNTLGRLNEGTEQKIRSLDTIVKTIHDMAD